MIRLAEKEKIIKLMKVQEINWKVISIQNKLKSILSIFNKKKSFSLNNLDLELLEFLNFKRGFFIEVGANDGISQSNTLYFEKYLEWNGILIEAIPDLAEKCRKNRPKSIVQNCALVAFDYPDETIEINYCNLMSCVEGAFDNDITASDHINSGKKFLKENESTYRITVVAKPLSDILDFYHVDNIDFMSLDVEGFEVEVLRGINFERHAPKYLLIEVRPELKEKIEGIIGKKYEIKTVLSSNDTYSDILYSIR